MGCSSSMFSRSSPAEATVDVQIETPRPVEQSTPATDPLLLTLTETHSSRPEDVPAFPENEGDLLLESVTDLDQLAITMDPSTSGRPQRPAVVGHLTEDERIEEAIRRSSLVDPPTSIADMDADVEAMMERQRLDEAIQRSKDDLAIQKAVEDNDMTNKLQQAYLLDQDWQIYFLIQKSLEEAKIQEAILRSLEAEIKAGENELREVEREIQEMKAPHQGLCLPPGASVWVPQARAPLQSTSTSALSQSHSSSLSTPSEHVGVLPPPTPLSPPPSSPVSSLSASTVETMTKRYGEEAGRGRAVVWKEGQGGTEVQPQGVLVMQPCALLIPQGGFLHVPPQYQSTSMSLPEGALIVPEDSAGEGSADNIIINKDMEYQTIMVQGGSFITLPSNANAKEVTMPAGTHIICRGSETTCSEDAEGSDPIYFGPLVTVEDTSSLILPPGTKIDMPDFIVYLHLPAGTQVVSGDKGTDDIPPRQCLRVPRSCTLALPPNAKVVLPFARPSRLLATIHSKFSNQHSKLSNSAPFDRSLAESNVLPIKKSTSRKVANSCEGHNEVDLDEGSDTDSDQNIEEAEGDSAESEVLDLGSGGFGAKKIGSDSGMNEKGEGGESETNEELDIRRGSHHSSGSKTRILIFSNEVDLTEKESDFTTPLDDQPKEEPKKKKRPQRTSNINFKDRKAIGVKVESEHVDGLQVSDQKAEEFTLAKSDILPGKDISEQDCIQQFPNDSLRSTLIDVSKLRKGSDGRVMQLKDSQIVLNQILALGITPGGFKIQQRPKRKTKNSSTEPPKSKPTKKKKKTTRQKRETVKDDGSIVPGPLDLSWGDQKDSDTDESIIKETSSEGMIEGTEVGDVEEKGAFEDVAIPLEIETWSSDEIFEIDGGQSDEEDNDDDDNDDENVLANGQFSDALDDRIKGGRRSESLDATFGRVQVWNMGEEGGESIEYRVWMGPRRKPTKIARDSQWSEYEVAECEEHLATLRKRQAIGVAELRGKRARMAELEKAQREKARELKMMVLKQMPSTVPTHNLNGRKLRVEERIREFQRIHHETYNKIFKNHPEMDPKRLLEILEQKAKKPVKVTRPPVDLESFAYKQRDAGRA